MRIRDWIADAFGVVMLFGICYGILFLGALFQ